GGGDQAREHLILVAHELVGLRRETIQMRLTRISVQEFDQLPRFPHWQLAQHKGVDQAEDRGVGAYSQGQRQHSDGSEAKVPPELPQGIADVLDQAAHACTSAINFFSSSSATTLPSNRCTSRSACLAKRGSCVTMQMVAPSRCRFCNSSMTASPLRESRFPVGSSASRIEGFPPSARATATRCCWPPESCEG